MGAGCSRGSRTGEPIERRLGSLHGSAHGGKERPLSRTGRMACQQRYGAGQRAQGLPQLRPGRRPAGLFFGRHFVPHGHRLNLGKPVRDSRIFRTGNRGKKSRRAPVVSWASGACGRQEKRRAIRSPHLRLGTPAVLSYWLPGARGFLPLFFSRPPPHGLVVRGRAHRSSGFHPQAVWPDHLVHQYERCESDRVADRPFALHVEALDRRGRDTRLVSPVRAGVCTRINERLSPWCVGVLPGISARTRHAGRGQDEVPTLLLHSDGQSMPRAKPRKRRGFFGLAHNLCRNVDR
jgi:hypothetical protein